jgi:uncharacterized protein (TIGR02996 family)
VSALARLLAAGTPKFNALRKEGRVPLDQSGATLSQLFFARADLSKLDLSNAELDECTVSETDFRDANLSGAYLHGGRYERCDFRGARFEGASFEAVEFVDCDFTGALALDTVELEAVTGLGVVSSSAPALSEEPRFVPGHVASHPALEAELDAHPDDAQRWLVYGDWLQSEGDLRGELVTRQQRGEGFEAFIDEHVETLFGVCADEVRGGGQVPEVQLEWRHGFVYGATLASLNRERNVDLGELARRLLPLPVCRFLRRLSFGLTHAAVRGGREENDYAPVIAALAKAPELARVRHLEFGVQEVVIDEEYGEAEPLHPVGDLSAMWSHVPRLRELMVKGAEVTLGEVVLPELRAVTLELQRLDEQSFSEVLAARWPKLEHFTLSDTSGAVELEPLLHVLSPLPLRHLGLRGTAQTRAVLEGLVRSPLLKRLRVLDLSGAQLHGEAFEYLRKNLAAFRHLERLDLTGAADPHEEDALAKAGDFIVFRPAEDTRPVEETQLLPAVDDYDDEPEPPEEDLEPVAPNADLDIPDEHGD